LISKPFQDSSTRDNHGLSLPGSISLKFGGVGRNVAELIHRGAPTISCSLLTSVGSDKGKLDSFAELLVQVRLMSLPRSFSEYLISHLSIRQDCSSIGLSLRAIPVAGAKTSFYNANLHSNGDLRAAVCDFSCMESVSSSTLAEHLDPLSRTRLVIADANLSIAALSSVATFAAKKGIPLFGLATSAPKVVRWVSCLQELSYLILNQAELNALLDHLQAEFPRAGNPENSKVAVCLQTLARFAPKSDIVCTVGSRGAYVYIRRNASVVHVPAAPCDVVLDVTGAGDSMAAGIATGILKGMDIVESTRMGSSIAAATISAGSIRSCPVKTVVQSHFPIKNAM
jgi:sugar/nucleoside kinase (ribokinase family)